MQWDFADGPLVAGRRTWLWCAWLAWSRYRVVLPLVDRTLASVVLALERVSDFLCVRAVGLRSGF
jgi:hypothetical protein